MASQPKTPKFEIDGYPKGIAQFESEARSAVASQKRAFNLAERFLKHVSRSLEKSSKAGAKRIAPASRAK